MKFNQVNNNLGDVFNNKTPNEIRKENNFKGLELDMVQLSLLKKLSEKPDREWDVTDLDSDTKKIVKGVKVDSAVVNYKTVEIVKEFEGASIGHGTKVTLDGNGEQKITQISLYMKVGRCPKIALNTYVDGVGIITQFIQTEELNIRLGKFLFSWAKNPDSPDDRETDKVSCNRQFKWFRTYIVPDEVMTIVGEELL